MKALVAVATAFGLFSLESLAEIRVVESEATILSGIAAVSNINESASGYIHIKYHAPLTLARKAYFQFNLSNSFPDLDSSAKFQISFQNTFPQRIQLWALNQSYTNFNADISWNSAPANDTNSNSLLTNGLFTASPIGLAALVPVSGATPYSFTIPWLGDFLFDNKITFVIAGVDDPSNSASGLRLTMNSATLSFSSTNSPTAETNHYDVYFVSGQSNMDGRGYTNDLTGEKLFWNQPQTNTLIFYANPALNNDPINPTYVAHWQTFKPGFCVPPGFNGAPLPSQRFGPELSFAKTVAEQNPNRRIALIKISKGGTSLNSHWKVSSGYMFATFTNMARVALSELTDAGHSYTVRGMIWHQGESDSTGTGLANYETNMIDLITAVRSNLGIANLPFVIGEIATNKPAAARAIQFNLAQTIPYVGFASADSLQTFDGTHFDSESVLILGQRFADALEQPDLRFNDVTIKGGDVEFTAIGLGKAPFYLLSSTNLNLSRDQWTILSTNRFDAFGQVQITNPIPASARTFYSLKLR